MQPLLPSETIGPSDVDDQHPRQESVKDSPPARGDLGAEVAAAVKRQAHPGWQRRKESCLLAPDVLD